jgi:DNA modification methylase
MTQPYSLHTGDCLDVLKALDAESIDAIVTDPPYGLAFMGKKWDYDVPSTDIWQECLRVLKPGGHLLAFAGTRTQHRMACRIEDAGFEIRDMIAWVYGSGFPKSHDVSKAIDKAAGAEREVVGSRVADDIRGGNMHAANRGERHIIDITAPATEAARQWSGWGTALKPALEPITMARKPLIGTVAENVLEHGTGAINVDGCRVGTDDTRAPSYRMTSKGRPGGGFGNDMDYTRIGLVAGSACGRWPANFIHDGSDEVVGLFPQSKSTGGQASVAKGYGEFGGGSRVIENRDPGFGDSGSAARFFYCPKASKAEREAGLDGMESIHRVNGNKWTDQDYRVTNGERPPSAESGPRTNHHPTVKPIDLMAYLCRLITPPNGTILDPFTGSGSTGVAALREGFKFIGIELNPEYAEIARKRIENELNKAPLFTNA